MLPRNTHRWATAVACVAVLLATTAWGSGPSGGDPVFADYQVCKGGPNKAADCMFDVDCPNSKCVIDWVTGPGTRLRGTITATYDDQVRDWRDDIETDNQAVTVTLEVKANGAKHILAETYQEHDNPELQPEVLGWGGLPFFEDEWASSLGCGEFLYARPETKMGEALLAIAGLPSTKVPVVGWVKAKTETFDHSHSSDTLGTTVRCQVKIRFWNEP